MSFFRDTLGGYVSDYADSLSVSVKTNLGDEIPLYRPGTSGPGLLSLLGIEYALIVRDGRGEVVTTYNEPPATDPLRQAALWALVAGGLFVLVRGVMP